jgi:hypothetical protein
LRRARRFKASVLFQNLLSMISPTPICRSRPAVADFHRRDGAAHVGAIAVRVFSVLRRQRGDEVACLEGRARQCLQRELLMADHREQPQQIPRGRLASTAADARNLVTISCGSESSSMTLVFARRDHAAVPAGDAVRRCGVPRQHSATAAAMVRPRARSTRTCTAANSR